MKKNQQGDAGKEEVKEDEEEEEDGPDGVDQLLMKLSLQVVGIADGLLSLKAHVDHVCETSSDQGAKLLQRGVRSCVAGEGGEGGRREISGGGESGGCWQGSERGLARTESSGNRRSRRISCLQCETLSGVTPQR